MEALRLKKDLTIPAGTILFNCDGDKTEYINGNYQAILGPHKDSVAYLTLSDDLLELDCTLVERIEI